MDMRPLLEHNPDRREFFRDASRYVLMGILAAIAVLSTKSSRLRNQRCINRGLCRGCFAFADCELPQALSAKQARDARLQEKQSG